MNRNKVAFVLLLVLAWGCASTVYVERRPHRVPDWYRMHKTYAVTDSSAAASAPLYRLDWRFSPDLVIEVWDRRSDGAFIGARVKVPISEDESLTDETGRTRALLVPVNARKVEIIVIWEGEDKNPHSKLYEVQLGHAYTSTQRVVIDAGPLRRR